MSEQKPVILSIDDDPGDTRFEVRLPIDGPGAGG